MSLVQKLVYGSVALLIFFVIVSTVLLPRFRDTYTEGFGSTSYDSSTDLDNEYCIAKGSLTACTDCNSTNVDESGYETFLSTCHSLPARTNNTHCYACSDWGFRSTARGLLLLVLVIGLVFVAFLFFVKIRQ